MRVGYFDCFSGISGDMILGALIDLGVDIKDLDNELRKLPLEGYKLEVKRVVKQGISAIDIEVITPEKGGGRTLKDILTIIDRSTLDKDIKEKSKQIFTRLGETEAKIHNQDLSKVHLHEIGAIDTFIDIVGTLVGLKILGIERIICSPINVGKGLVQCAHGVLPVPAPITAELLKGRPIYTSGTEGELTTPTGAAIITSLTTDFGDLPLLTIENVGYGAGSMELETPNLLRLWVGDIQLRYEDCITEEITVLETNIDDMNPQFYEHVMDSLLRAGALDVFLTPVQMKKNRPGIMLTVITPREQKEKLFSILFEESTTLGVRVTETHRFSLPRSIHLVETKYGEIHIKVARKDGKIVNVTPEYDDCKKAAITHQVAVSEIYTEAQKAWENRKAG